VTRTTASGFERAVRFQRRQHGVARHREDRGFGPPAVATRWCIDWWVARTARGTTRAATGSTLSGSYRRSSPVQYWSTGARRSACPKAGVTGPRSALNRCQPLPTAAQPPRQLPEDAVSPRIAIRPCDTVVLRIADASQNADGGIVRPGTVEPPRRRRLRALRAGPAPEGVSSEARWRCRCPARPR
jgi:hypothetical protein